MNTSSDRSSSTQSRPADPPDTEPSRCHHRFANGKRCRLPGLDSQLGFCLRHFTLNAAANLCRQKTHDDSADLSADLLGLPTERSSPMQVKQFLARLLVLVTEGRISPRRAAVLVNITNQLRYSHTTARR